MKKKTEVRLRLAAVALYALLWIGGVVSYALWGGPPADTAWAAPALLYLAALLALAPLDGRERAALLGAGVAAWALEALALRTGFPFGHYVYTANLAPSPLGVPLAIACAWLALLAYVREGITRRVRKRWTAALAGGAWMLALDLLIDPLAAGPLDLWRWDRSGVYYGIPWTNFAGWFAVGAALFAALGPSRRETPRRGVGLVGLSLIVFFLLLAGVFRLWGAGVFGLVLLAVHALVFRRR